MTDYAAMNAEIRARARAEVSALKHDDVADALPDELRKVQVTPSIYVMIRRREAHEITPGLKTQRVMLDVDVGVVVGGLSGTTFALKGNEALDVVSAAVTKSLHWYQLTGALERLKFRGEDDAIRDGGVFARQQRYETSVQETYS